MRRMLSLGISALAVAALSAAWSLAGQAAETKGPVTDDIGVVEIPKDAPIVIGGYWVISGPGYGARPRFEARRRDRVRRDRQHRSPAIRSSSSSRTTAAMPKAARPRRPSSPTVPEHRRGARARPARALQPPARRSCGRPGIVNIGTATTAPSLTAPDRKPDYFGYMRTIYSDADQGFNDAEWFFKELKCKTLATIHDGSPYASQLAKAAANHFKELGGEVVAEEAVTPTDVDMRPVLTGIAHQETVRALLPDLRRRDGADRAPGAGNPRPQGHQHHRRQRGAGAGSCSRRRAMRRRTSASPMSTSRPKRWARSIRSSSRSIQANTAKGRSTRSMPRPMTPA